MAKKTKRSRSRGRSPDLKTMGKSFPTDSMRRDFEARNEGLTFGPDGGIRI